MQTGDTRMTAVGDMDLSDRLGRRLGLHAGPNAQPLEQQPTTVGQRRGARIKTGLQLTADRRVRLNQLDTPAVPCRQRLQSQRQAGADHATADNTDAAAHAGSASAWRAAAISASISSGSLGTLAVNTS